MSTGSPDVATDATLMVVVGEDLQGTNDGEANSNNNDEAFYQKRSKTCRLGLYGVGFVLAMVVVVFLSGAIFSCRAFDNGDLVYGYRGFMNNNNDCTNWEEHQQTNTYNEEWYGYLQTYFNMGIAAVALSVLALAVWSMEAVVWARTDSTDAALLALRITFALAILASGVLSFFALILNCDNVPPLAEGGVDCHLTAWTALGFFASLLACATTVIPCLFGICPLPCVGMRQLA